MLRSKFYPKSHLSGPKELLPTLEGINGLADEEKISEVKHAIDSLRACPVADVHSNLENLYRSVLPLLQLISVSHSKDYVPVIDALDNEKRLAYKKFGR